jgi:hypothetical protein
MNGPRYTAMVLTLNVLGLVLWDVFAAWRWGIDATISAVLYEAVLKYPVIAFTIGGAAGHAFWPLRRS